MFYAVLLVDNKRHARMLEEWLSSHCQIVPLASEDQFPEKVDLVVLDGPHLKRLRSLVTERRESEAPVFLPFLLVMQRRKGSIPTRYLGTLVDEVILKPIEKDEFQARVRNLLRMRELSLDLKKKHDQVARLSITDDVSGFRNTRYLHRYLDRLLASPTSFEKQVSLVFFDLDNFKRVVDEHGHLLGAKVLRQVAEAVHGCLDDEDRIVRYGGDEFIVILPRQDKTEGELKTQRMCKVIENTVFLEKDGLVVRVTASFGLATFPGDATDKRALLAEADRCLFQSKHSGKNKVIISTNTEVAA